MDISYFSEGTRFFIGFLGTFTYFMCVKYRFLYFELDDPKKNSNALSNNMIALVFFCLIGGIIPILMDIRLLLGCFIQGFILRATLSSFYSAALSKEKEIGGLGR